MMVRTLALLLIIAPKFIDSMEKKEKSITYRLTKVCYQQPPQKEMHQYMPAIQVNGIKLDNDEKFHFIPVFNNKLYIQQSEPGTLKGNVIQNALNALFETKKITITPTQEIISIKPIRLHSNQQGSIVPGKSDGIEVEENTGKIQWILLEATNKIGTTEGLNFFNGVYIPDKQAVTIRAPEGYISIETIGIRPISRKNLPSSGYLKLWFNYYRQKMNLKNNYLNRLNAKIINAPYLTSHYEVTYVPLLPQKAPAPLPPYRNVSRFNHFEKTYFNLLPNELLEPIAQYVVYNSRKTCISKSKNNSQNLELENNDLCIPSFESLPVEEIRSQTLLQTK